jgi:hypothetical protein
MSDAKLLDPIFKTDGMFAVVFKQPPPPNSNYRNTNAYSS